MTPSERHLLSLVCLFSLTVTVVTVILIAVDAIDTTVPITVGLGVVAAVYVALQRRAANRRRQRPLTDAVDALRR